MVCGKIVREGVGEGAEESRVPTEDEAEGESHGAAEGPELAESWGPVDVGDVTMSDGALEDLEAVESKASVALMV